MKRRVHVEGLAVTPTHSHRHIIRLSSTRIKEASPLALNEAHRHEPRVHRDVPRDRCCREDKGEDCGRVTRREDAEEGVCGCRRLAVVVEAGRVMEGRKASAHAPNKRTKSARMLTRRAKDMVVDFERKVKPVERFFVVWCICQCCQLIGNKRFCQATVISLPQEEAVLQNRALDPG